jgi:CubicO group peptidase (beta-lactamase class C family)
MKLEMAGKLRTTDTIDKYFPGAPDDKKSITLHQLLTHSAGLESDYGSGDAEQVSREEFLRRVFSRPLRTPPGAAYHYSNAGFSLLGMVVESLSGQTWEDFLHDQLFVPAGMRHTGAKLSRFQVADLPHGYANGEDRGTFTQDYGPDGPHWNQRANGGVLSTVGDMYRWHLALQGEKILSADAKKKMFTPYVREGPDADTFYGYGWVVGKTPRGTTLIEHNAIRRRGRRHLHGEQQRRDVCMAGESDRHADHLWRRRRATAGGGHRSGGAARTVRRNVHDWIR